MWKPSKEDCLFLITSIFVGIKNNKIKYYLDFGTTEDNLIHFNYIFEKDDYIKIGSINNIRYYSEHKVVNMKDLLYSIKEFENDYKCEVYYYPFSKENGKTLFDMIPDIETNFKEYGLD